LHLFSISSSKRASKICADDPYLLGQTRIAAFLDTLQRLGWAEGRNVLIEYRWSAGHPGREKASAAPRHLLALRHNCRILHQRHVVTVSKRNGSLGRVLPRLGRDRFECPKQARTGNP
jgi:hypothetical protein